MIDEEGGVSEVIQADVSSEESCRIAVARTVELYGGLHILVNIGMSKRHLQKLSIVARIFLTISKLVSGVLLVTLQTSTWTLGSGTSASM